MENRTRREARKKEFVKLFDTLTGSQHRWQAWQDMIWLFATSIANSVKTPYWEKREQRYLEIIQKYDKQRQQVFPELFAMLVSIMDDSVNNGFYGDFLGELFMVLELGNAAGGQFFTPYSVCMVMAEMTYDGSLQGEIDRKGWTSCNDCACGAGATLIAMAEAMQKHHVNYQQKCMFVGQDIDYTTGLMCYIQLSLLGCAGYVHIGNTLTDPVTGHVLFGDGSENTWYTPMYFSTPWEMRRQAVRMDAFFRGMDQGIREHAPEALPEPEAQPEPEPEPVIIEVGGKKARRKPKGQLMFEF